MRVHPLHLRSSVTQTLIFLDLRLRFGRKHGSRIINLVVEGCMLEPCFLQPCFHVAGEAGGAAVPLVQGAGHDYYYYYY